MADATAIQGRRLVELPFPAAAEGAEVYAEQGGVPVRLKVGAPNGLAEIDASGRLQAGVRDIISVRDAAFGAVGDGVTNDDAAFAAAGAAISGYIEVPAGTYVLSAAPALGKFWGEGVIMVGGVRAYLHPRPGPVYEIFAEVFGADASGATDASAALQRAVDYAQDADLTLTLKARASYRLDTGLTFKHGMSAADTKRYAVRLNLNTATLLPQAGVCAITVVPRCLLADSASGRGEAYIEIRNGAINGASLASAKAIKVGAAGYVTSSFSVMLFENVLVTGFSGTDVSQFIEARHAHFSRWVQRGGGFVLRCMTTGAFCGDFMFEWCEFTGSTLTGRPFKVECSAGEVRGVKLIGGAIYGSGTLLNATSTGAIGDVWFSGGVQFDGPNAPADERALEINASGSSRIFQIHVDTAYFVAYEGQLIYATSGSTATIRQLNIAGCGIGPTETGTSGFAIHMLSVESVSIRGVEFDGVTAAMAAGTKALMNFDGCTNVAVQGNKATQCTGVGYMVVIGNGDKHIITDNMANVLTAVVNDYTSGTPTRLVADNLLV